MKISLLAVKCFVQSPDMVFPKMGPISLIQWMRKSGFTDDCFEFLDLDLMAWGEEEIRAHFRSYQPDIIGLSAVVASAYKSVKEISRYAKEECPNALVVMGGNLSAAANVVLSKTGVDIVVAGDGEYPWVDLLRIVEERVDEGRPPLEIKDSHDKLRGIPGLVFMDEQNELIFSGYPRQIPGSELECPNLDLMMSSVHNDTPTFDYHFGEVYINEDDPFGYDISSQGEASAKYTPVRTFTWSPTKGCVARCSFCQRAMKGIRAVSLDKIEAFIVEMKTKYNVKVMWFQGENLGSDVAWVESVAKLMKKHDMFWVCVNIRATQYTYEEMKRFKENNCLALSWGFESGSERILNLMEKKVTPQQQIDCLNNIINAGLMVNNMNIMHGYPGEDDQTISETGQILGEMCYWIGFHPADVGSSFPKTWWVMPFQGTPLYEYGRELGILPQTIDEEDAMLEAGYSYKYNIGRDNWVNLNGSTAREYLFWEHLMRNEAARKFEELAAKKPPTKTWQGQIFADRHKLNIRKNYIRSKLRYFLYGYKNPIYSLLPRGLVYPVLRNVLYGLHLVRKALPGSNNPVGLSEFLSPAPKLDTSDIPLKGNIASSLRGVVRKMRTPTETEKDAMWRELTEAQ